MAGSGFIVDKKPPPSPRQPQRRRNADLNSSPLDIHESPTSPSLRVKFFPVRQQLKQEWVRLQSSVVELYKSYQGNGVVMLPRGRISLLHDDIHFLLRSHAGSFLFDFIEKILVPSATQVYLNSIMGDETGRKQVGLETFAQAWTHFYRNILPYMDMIFGQVKSASLTGVRDVALIAYRDRVVLPFMGTFSEALPAMRIEGSSDFTTLRHMFLMLKGVKERGPPSENALQLEKLLALVVSPYQGYQGLYLDYNPEPVVSSNELQVSHLRRLSVVDPRKLSRPLSMNSNKPVETLQDLFQLSADRLRGKGMTREARQRSVSTCDSFYIGSLGY